MERSGIETLLEAAALDAASFFNTSSIYGQQQDGHINQQYSAPPPQAQLNSTQSSVYSPANSPDISYTLYSANYNQNQATVEQQPSPYSPPDLSPLPAKAKVEVTATEVNPYLSQEVNGISSSQEVWDHCSLCTPETSPQGKVDWIECSVCQQWFHYACVGLSSKEAKNVDEFHCPNCAMTHGPSTLLRKSKRKHAAVDYVALHEGESVTTDEHPYCQIIQNREFHKDDFQRINGYELTREFAEMGGVSQPVVIPKDRKDGLDLKIPGSLTVRDVANMIGGEAKVEVIDVPTQHESPNWDLQRWADYYEQPADQRDRVRNVISLEISNTKLGHVIQRPKFVRDMDLVQKVWLDELKDKGEWPKVSLYCLMSVKNAYTDFHIDFGGSSVFYHIVEGSKVFLFAPPTPTNLSKYEHWCLSSDQSKIFFGDLIKECHKVQLTKGDTMIIPSGWIHAVYTPVDSLVIGGNFLTARDISMEIQIAKIEKKTKVPRKFRFPLFSKVLWLAANDYMERQRKEPDFRIDHHELQGLIDLASYLHEEALIATGQSKSATAFEVKAAKGSIPGSLKDAVRFAKSFANWVTSVANVPAFKWAEVTDDDLEDSNGKEVSTLKISKKRKRSVASFDWPRAKLQTPIDDTAADSSVDNLAAGSNHVEAGHSSRSFDSLKTEQPDHKECETELAVDKLADVSAAITLPLQESEPKSTPSFEQVLQEKVQRDITVQVVAPVLMHSDITIPPLQPEVAATNEANSLVQILDEQPSAATPIIKREEPFFDEKSEELSPPPDGLDDTSLDLDSIDYDSDAVSEASTIIEGEIAETLTSMKAKKNFVLYQELMDLHNSRTRGSIREAQSASGNDKLQGTPRRHSIPHRNVIKEEKDDSQRSRRRSTPGGKRSSGSVLDRNPANGDKQESADQETPASVKRGRGRPRKNPIVVDAESERMASTKMSSSGHSSRRQSSDKKSGSGAAVPSTTELDLNDEVMQRLIREAQFGIRSRR
ncbi:hypothetical protein V1520DRAFT_330263 [Lipomyces starkeyi]|uniref:JmjC domain-containing histone demethylation protein 1 n=1 Tax=Lipomyces starkeyi NRRL Y-11557 TaxID=675824 RepID=A0A1E3QAZ4_LIPST|nr:hypothetical protein LIPSTDRAFT_69885 [Lipomyces starkeyi NRRL Y-11557]